MATMLQAQIQAKQMRKVAERAEEQAYLAASRAKDQQDHQRVQSTLRQQQANYQQPWHGLRKFEPA